MAAGKPIMTEKEINDYKNTIKNFEINTGCELVVAVTKQSDPYPAANWRFGLVVGFMTSIALGVFTQLDYYYLLIAQASVTTICGVYANFEFVNRHFSIEETRDRECTEKAIETFQVHAQSLINHQVSVMIFLSLLEHETVILVDEKLKDKLTTVVLDKIIAKMGQSFAKGNFSQGLTHGANELEALILQHFPNKVQEISPNQLPNEIIWI